MKSYINEVELKELVDSSHRDPHHILGMHKLNENKYYINAYQPYAKKVIVENLNNNKQYIMEKIDESGFFTLVIDRQFEYKFIYEGFNGEKWELIDPYNFEPIISEYDLYLFGNGTHYEIYKKLGAHMCKHNGVEGVHFAVWAPNAKRVSVIGDFCGWDGRIFPMRILGNSGIYELFIPGIKEMSNYKFEIKTWDNHILKKSDPYANYAELRPNTASKVVNINKYIWHDEKWMKKRDSEDVLNKPISVYEVHLGSWKKNGYKYYSYKELTHNLVNYVLNMGYTHIELMPIAEHPFDGSWGYQVTGYYAPSSRFGKPEDFMYFIDYCHQHNIGVILDWVPGHFPKDEHGLIRFDGTALYEHEDKRKGEHPHWGTMIFNYGRKEVTNFLIGNAFYWLDLYHIDGLRVDAVASMLYLDYGKESNEWIPNMFGGRENLEAVEFLKHLNSVLYAKYPGILMIAEESTSWPGVSRPTNTGGLGFGLKWNMGWMNDFLKYISKDPIHRKYHHNDLTFSMVYAYTENFMLVLSHDEVVHGKGSMISKMPGDYWQKFANLRLAYGFMYAHPGKKLLFMGNDIAQFNEWNENSGIEWDILQFDKHRELNLYVKELNAFYKKENALWYNDFKPDGFEWINCNNADESIVSFVRYAKDKLDTVIVIANFTPVVREFYRIGVPYKGVYKEVFNSDNLKFGGSGIINFENIKSTNIEWDGRKQSIIVKVPPLALTILKYSGGENS